MTCHDADAVAAKGIHEAERIVAFHLGEWREEEVGGG